MNETIKNKLKSLVFNIVETILIFLIGKLLNLPINFVIMIMLTFVLSRMCFGKTMHFKTWYRCLICSLTIMLSLFLILKVDLVISILFTIFSALIMTGRANINDMYLWKPKDESKYKDIEEYVKYNLTNSKLIEFEENLKKADDVLFLIYKDKFKKEMSLNKISEELEGMDTARIVEKLDQIALAIRIHCAI